MRKPLYTLPFIFVYKLVRLPFLIIKYFVIGLIAIIKVPFNITKDDKKGKTIGSRINSKSVKVIKNKSNNNNNNKNKLEEKRIAEEQRKIRQQELAVKKAEMKAKKAEEKRIAEEQRKIRQQELAVKKAEMKAKKAEEKRIAEEQRKIRQQELAVKKAEMKAKKAEEKRIAEEQRKIRQQELAVKKAEMKAKKAEEKRIAEEQRKIRQQELAVKKAEMKEQNAAKKEQIKQQRKKEKEEKDNIEKTKLQKKIESDLEKKKRQEAEYIRKLELKEERKKLAEEKRQKKIELKEAKKKRQQKDEYTNENVVIEKKTVSDKLNDFFRSLSKLPGKIKNKIVDSYNNSTFVKNLRNKRDISRQALLINFDGEDAVKSNVKILYEYVGKNADGKVVKGYFEAFSKVEVHSFLLSEGFEVYSIKTSKWIQFLHGNASITNVKVKTKDLIFFVTQLSTYIKAGIPLVEALKILSRQYKKKSYQKIFKSMIYDLTMGENFSEAMSKQGTAFPRLLINMIKTAEMTGELPEALDDMANYYTQVEKTRKQMITAMTYPSIIFVISIGVSTFIMVYVVPKFVDIYASMNDAEIPGITKFVMATSDFLSHNLIWIALVTAAVVAIFVYLYKKIKFFKSLVQWTLMHLPVFGNVIIYNEVTMFTKTFASLLKHNVFITDSMEILNKITSNEIYKMLILDTITNLAKGEKISLAFKNHWAFPMPAYEMLVTGEKTGQLPEMMQKVSDYYQELHANSVTRIKTFVEPIMIIFLTGIVGVIVLSIVIPMFGMYSSLG